MANFSQNNHSLLFVGKDVAITGTSIDTLADGEVRCFTPGGTLYTEAAADANDEFIIAMGRGTGNEPLVSQKIKKDWVTRVSKKDYSAPAQRDEFIGYNGTTGSIEVNNSTLYRASINIIEGLVGSYSGVYVKDMVFESDASAAQSEIAVGLAGSGIGNFSREAEQVIKFSAVCNEAVTTANCFDNDATITNGSKVFSVATNLQYNTGAGTAAVGDFVRLGTAAGIAGATALTSDVYEIVSISGTNVTVDRPIQVASGTYTAAGNMAEVLTAAEGAAANWGVRLLGQASDFTVGKIDYKIINWNLALDSDSFGATTQTLATEPDRGTGTYEQIAELEYFLKGNNGEMFRMGEPNLFSSPTMALSTETYDVISIEMEKGRTDSLGYVNSPQTVMIAIPAGAPGGTEWYANGATDDTTDVLEDLLDGVPAYTTANSFDGTPLTGADLTCG